MNSVSAGVWEGRAIIRIKRTIYTVLLHWFWSSKKVWVFKLNMRREKGGALSDSLAHIVPTDCLELLQPTKSFWIYALGVKHLRPCQILFNWHLNAVNKYTNPQHSRKWPTWPKAYLCNSPLNQKKQAKKIRILKEKVWSLLNCPSKKDTFRCIFFHTSSVTQRVKETEQKIFGRFETYTGCVGFQRCS